ncbi:MAG: serine/threonine-protein phosphatase, partial [Burkholderiales bacterium]
LLELGLISVKEQETHPDRNKVLNCIGSPFEPIIEVTAGVDLEPGDTLLLCSDGLWSGVGESELVAMLADCAIDVAIPELVHRAVAAQGHAADNTTALAMVWAGERTGDVSSKEVPEGAMTTTIGMLGPEGQDDAGADFTDEDIERTIEEIREAIQKSGAK